MSKQLLIRVDGDPRIGIGHVMRCMALARAWKIRGGDVAFISCCDNHDLIEQINYEAFRFVLIEHRHPHPSDIHETLAFSRKYFRPNGTEKNWMILDGYNFELPFQKAFFGKGFNLMIIDDYNHLPEYHCDLLLNQNIYARSLHYNLNGKARSLLGVKYTMIRPEFQIWKIKKRKINTHAYKILITFGGADLDNVTIKVIKAISMLDKDKIQLKVIIGPANPHLKDIERVFLSSRLSGEILHSVKKIPDLMYWADIAVTAGGGTCLELASLGVPFLIIVLSENQKPGAEEYAKRDIAINLGWHADLAVEDITSAIKQLLLSKKMRVKFSKNGKNLLDSLGANRIIEKMSPTKLELRDAELEDCRILWKWTNDPVTRAMSFSSDYIPFEMHKSWFSSRVQNPDIAFYLASNQNGIPFGQIRFESDGRSTFVSLNLSPDFRGCGLGQELIRQATKKYMMEKKGDRVIALIKRGNNASIRAFKKAGYYKIRDESFHGFKAVRMVYEGDAAQ